METMKNQTVFVTPNHDLGFGAPSRLRAVKRAGYISAPTQHLWIDSNRLAPDSAPGNPPA